ncbi:sulfatase-like hydrolase/transferase [Microbacterium sp. AGC85]
MKPNVLLIVADQHRADCLGVEERYPVKTPNLDALAAGGVRFTHAFTPIPLCTPARVSLLTGLRPESAGYLWNYDLGPRIPAVDPDSDVWPRTLADAGYRSQYVGKWHVHPDLDPTAFGYDEYVSLDDYLAWREKEHPGNTMPRHDWDGVIDKLPTSESRTHWLACNTERFIREASAQDGPWHARLDFVEPHLPCQPTEDFARRYASDDIPAWGGFADPLRNKPYIQRQQLVSWGVDGRAWKDWAPIVARYYAVIEQMDDAIGRVLATLDETGQAENTIVIYTADHGDMCGSHGMMDKHHVMYDDVTRVPLIVRWPNRLTTPAVVDAFVCNMLDLPPTLTSLLELAPLTAQHGAAIFVPGTEGLPISDEVSNRDHIISTYNGQQFGLFTQRMIRSRQWKYVWNPTDIDELYDLEGDPFELENRVSDESLSGPLAVLRRDLYHQLVADGDRIMTSPWVARQLLEGRKIGVDAPRL